jgi:transketolase
MGHLDDKRIKELELIAVRLRRHVIRTVADAGSGHQGGPLGLADIFTALYFHVMRHDPKNPVWEERDPLILSNGHVCPIRYAAMAEAGYFPVEELKTLRRFGTRLQGHPERLRLPGSETTSGPLGAGLAQAAGLAYAYKMDGKTNHVFCVTSDAEHQAGLHWEAAMFAGKYRLDNLVAIVDRNNIQIDGDTEDIMPIDPVDEKYRAFNWYTVEINGNEMDEVVHALETAKTMRQKPVMIIAHTTPGKGVSYMENNYVWHSAVFKKGQVETAMKELAEWEKRLKEDYARLG